jgi:hypothetical protein
MKKEFVPYELALELKQLGFDEPCLGYFDGLKQLHFCAFENMSDKGFVSAPIYSQAFRWFRENHNCHHTINLNKKYVGIAYSSVVNFSIDEFNTYEEAEKECLIKLIEIKHTEVTNEQR